MKNHGVSRFRTLGAQLTAVMLLALLSLPAAVFGQQMQDSGTQTETEGHGSMMGAQDPSRAREMIGGAHGGGPVENEEDFLLEMIPHHLEAADAAVLVAVTTDDGEIRSLTENIYRAQFREVEQLKIHYARTFGKVPIGRPYDRMMRDLNVVEGSARDRRFVEDMIPHHEAAVWMARQVLGLPEISEETRRFAQQVVDDQEREIAFMKEWLVENPASLR